MIAQNELRHGNWVNFINKPKKIGGSLDIDYASKARDIQPIPLTNEILEKLNLPEHLSTLDAGGSFILCFERRALSVVLIDTYSNTVIRIISYLHDFQNIYFALTGEELEINL